MGMLWFFFEGEPVAQGRPRIYRNRNGIHTVDPEKSREYKEALGLFAQGEMSKDGISPFEGPVKATLRFARSVPRSWSAAKRKSALSGGMLPVSRPDLDNYVKAALDALNGVVWEDDGQVTEIVACKVYAERPEVLVRIEDCPQVPDGLNDL